MNNVDERPTPAPRVGNLAGIGDVRHEAARLYKAARRGEVAAGDASKLATVLGLIARLLEADEFERRLEAVEAKLVERGARR